MNTQTLYQQAIQFATAKHQERDQRVPGTQLPYVVHLSNVALEILVAAAHTTHFDTALAVQVALLHDTREDTHTSFEELEQRFGGEVAQGVEAVTKNTSLPKYQQMADSLQPPPAHWNPQKKVAYLEEARMILAALSDGNDYLANRLSDCIQAYQKNIE